MLLKNIKLLLCVMLLSFCTAQAQSNIFVSSYMISKLPYKDVIEVNQPKNALPINQKNWEAHDLQKLEDFNPDFKYFLKGYVIIGKQKVFIICRDYAEESINWMVLLNDDFLLADFIVTAYDNSEGAMSKKSDVLSNGNIVVHVSDIYADEVKKEMYEIQGGKFKLRP